MYDILTGMRIIEISSFVAAPLAGLALAKLGADVIRIDPEGGGLDYQRWPLSEDGTSLYWTGLNKAKRSAALDLHQEADRQIFHQLLAASGVDGGIVLTNLTGPQWLSYDALKEIRPDVILASLSGRPDGSPAVDYTVNSAVGVPFATGNARQDNPVNNVLPAWDAIAGMTLAVGLLAAERFRSRTGKGQQVKLALSNTGYSLISDLGYMAEAEVLRRNRPAIGNHVYGAFGHNLPTRDGRQVMVAVMTARHWHALIKATDCANALAEVAKTSGQNLETDAGRYAARDSILAVLCQWSLKYDLAEITDIFNANHVLWGPYQTFQQMADEDPWASTQNPLFDMVEQPGVGQMRAAGSPLEFSALKRHGVKPASLVGTDTEEILKQFGITRK